MLKTSGKVVTVFLIIIGFLLISLTAVSMFFFQKEIERRKAAEAGLDLSRSRSAQLEQDLKESKKQAFLLEEKNKEADERINSLLDELELQEALKAEMKNETADLKGQLQKEVEAKEQVRKELLNDLSKAEQKIIELEAQVKVETNRQEELKSAKEELEKKIQSNGNSDSSKADFNSILRNDYSLVSDSSENTLDAGKVELEKIVVVPNEIPEGRILSIDSDTEFVIINLGDKDGVTSGTVMSISRGQDYLGDIKVTRVQAEMSAADLIPPLSSKILRKNDQVVLKQ